MPTSPARVAEVSYAIRPGRTSAASEDRVFIANDAVVVLDGATDHSSSAMSGGWLADALGSEVCAQLDARPGDDLRSLLARSIEIVRDRHELRPGSAPSTTVAIVRWVRSFIDVLVLGDTAVIAIDTTGNITEIRDERLARVAQPQRIRARHAQHDEERHIAQQNLIRAERAARNRPDGYWIAEADPHAARQAVVARWAAEAVSAILVVTDGVSIGVDRYGTPPSWADAVSLARADPALLIDSVHQIELIDADRTRWPRSKQHDDKAVALVRFAAVSDTQLEPRTVVAAIVTSDHGVLVGRRNDGKPPWTFIAGEIEPGESPAEAAIREVKEEAGLLVRAGEREIGRRVHPRTGRTMIYLACYPLGRTDVFVGDEDELAEVRWARLAEAEQLLPDMYEPVHTHLGQELGHA